MDNEVIANTEKTSKKCKKKDEEEDSKPGSIERSTKVKKSKKKGGSKEGIQGKSMKKPKKKKDAKDVEASRSVAKTKSSRNKKKKSKNPTFLFGLFRKKDKEEKKHKSDVDRKAPSSRTPQAVSPCSTSTTTTRTTTTTPTSGGVDAMDEKAEVDKNHSESSKKKKSEKHGPPTDGEKKAEEKTALEKKSTTEKKVAEYKNEADYNEKNQQYKKFVDAMSELEKSTTLAKFYNETLLRIPVTGKTFTTFFANGPKNRSSDNFCMNETRVKLKVKDANDATKNDYIHANKVAFDGLKRQYILTQHPLSNTLDDYWNMVFNENVEVIVSLTNKTGPEFPAFFPCEKEAYFNYGDYFVTCKSVKPAKSKHTPVEYILEVLPNGCSNSNLVKLLSYAHWAKGFVPSSHKLPLMIAKNIAKGRPQGPIVVQCENGVNQSATYVFIDAMLTILAEKHEVSNLEKHFEELITQRSSVMTQRIQFIYAVYVVLIFIKSKCEVDQYGKEMINAINEIEGKLSAEFNKLMSPEPNENGSASPETSLFV